MDIQTCHYCDKELYPGDITVDHLVPRAKGGRDERWNKALSCRDCNSRKADDWPDCNCNRCRKARRIHWEKWKINEEKPGKRVS